MTYTLKGWGSKGSLRFGAGESPKFSEAIYATHTCCCCCCCVEELVVAVPAFAASQSSTLSVVTCDLNFTIKGSARLLGLAAGRIRAAKRTLRARARWRARTAGVAASVRMLASTTRCCCCNKSKPPLSCDVNCHVSAKIKQDTEAACSPIG